MATSTHGSVLIADSDASIRGLLAAIVHRLGRRPVMAEDERVAAELLSAQTFEAAVLDFRLAQRSGVELMQLVAETQPELVRRTVIITTGRVEREGALREVAAVLRKPFSLDELMKNLQRCCDGAG